MTITREQVERAIEGMRDDAGAKLDHLAYADSPVWDDGPLPTPTPERPAPRFKVGEWVRVTKGPDKPHMLPAFRKAIAEMRAGGASLSEVADAYWLARALVHDALRVMTREHDALITRLRAAEGRTAWQPIETVAVDETVLLWDPVRRGVRMGHVSIRRGCVYTHWMPLPAAPEAPHV